MGAKQTIQLSADCRSSSELSVSQQDILPATVTQSFSQIESSESVGVN